MLSANKITINVPLDNIQNITTNFLLINNKLKSLEYIEAKNSNPLITHSIGIIKNGIY